MLVITASALWFALVLPTGGDPKPPESKAPAPKPTPSTAPPAPTTAEPQPTTPPRMPTVTGRSYDEASTALTARGVTDISLTSAYTDVTLPSAPTDWTVCFQTPAPDTTIDNPQTTSANLALVHPTGTRRNPPPSPTTNPVDEAPPSVYYANCAAVRAAGQAPLYRGEPGYRPALDRDNDGTACDT
ncbi:excalibur calcium-binding domain-containing protein [Streptomyces smaragdinus]|uniref:excalibur calcium-binding domain-containing protein n=1 Tax=Streptomyces smaragdinus TaxID=2585196 RepID=UPI001886880B|nr:excalibur calcium-binding domain-containing protein [Streptomyces smaragdinus]